MADMIRPIGPGSIQPGKSLEAAPAEKSFKDVLVGEIEKVNHLQKEADRAIESLATGQTENIAEVLGAVKKAEIAFDMLMEVRNKVVDAYQEIMRMRI